MRIFWHVLHQSNTAESSPARPKGGQRPASAVQRERERERARVRTQASGFFREDFHHFCDESILICTELLASTGVHTPPYLAMKHTVSELVSVPTTQEHPVSGHSPGHRGLKSHDELDSARASRLDAEGDLRDLDGWRDFLILFDTFWRVLMAFGGISGHYIGHCWILLWLLWENRAFRINRIDSFQ